jgi:hypothetical protein
VRAFVPLISWLVSTTLPVIIAIYGRTGSTVVIVLTLGSALL